MKRYILMILAAVALAAGAVVPSADQQRMAEQATVATDRPGAH